MNQIHSSSLLCQLASMWKNQVLCDAVIKAGNSQIKAHRVVLVAACPMLHSMKNASVGSNLEVRLAADIKADAINTFLQYLYEGFMMLTEENTKDVEKIARVLQVDSVLKCCADFYKCLHAGDKYEYSFHDNAEFKHVRASDLLKVHERNKRTSEIQPPSPGVKRQRIQSRGSSDSFNDFGASDPWDRVPREGLMGSSSTRNTQPGVIEIMEDSVEIVHSDKPEDSGGTRRDNPQDRMSISVASQMKANNDVQIINASSGSEPPPRITASSSESSRFSSHPSFSHSQGSSSLGFRHDPNFTNPNSASGSRLPTSPSAHSRMPSPSSAYHLPQRTSAHSQPKPFAAGNAAQASKSYNIPSPGEQSRSSQDQSRVTAGASTLSFSSSSSSLVGPPSSSPSTSTQAPQPVALWRSTSSDAVATGSTAASQMSEKPLLHRSESTPATSDADISIVKVESEVSFDEQFHGDDPNVTFEPDDQSGDWNREDTSNEESNASEDKMPQWMADTMKDIAAGQGTTQEYRGLPNLPATYRSNLGRSPSLDPVNYIFIELGQPLPEGYVRLDEEEKVCVPSVWLNRTLSQCVGKPAFFTLKKLVNGFVNPWECKYGGTSAYKNTPLEPVFNALLCWMRQQPAQSLAAFEKSLLTSYPTNQYDTMNAVAKCRDPLTGQYHVAISEVDGKLKPCVLCTSQKVKTHSGWYCYTRKRCSAWPRVRDKMLPPQYADHKCVSVEGRKQNRCALCQHQNVKTKSGWDVITRLQCKQCDINLCKECFVGVNRKSLGWQRTIAMKTSTELYQRKAKSKSGVCFQHSPVERYVNVQYEEPTARLFLLSEALANAKQKARHSTCGQRTETAPTSSTPKGQIIEQELISIAEAALHFPQNNPELKQKRCALCRHQNITTKRGWVVLTNFCCARCLVPLCTGERNCFKIYHRLLFSGQIKALPTGRVTNTTDDRPSPSGDPSGGRSKLSEYIDKLHELQTKAMYFDMMRNRPKVSASSDPVEDIESADSSSEVLKGLDLTIRSSQQKHVPIYNKDRKYTPCLYCGRLKNRTRSGWRVNTFYRCLQCDVPLCVNDRNCFVLYHKYFLGMTNVENPGRRRSRDTGQVEVKKETNG
uniref:BTB domain-containing protein n=1 Tax=Magallana gigas TaxID=29159 RepID=A0A8W8ND86_MAGGI